MKRNVEQAAGDSANWEKIIQASQQRAQELFQPALSSLDNGDPVIFVLEKLRECLSKA